MKSTVNFDVTCGRYKSNPRTAIFNTLYIFFCITDKQFKFPSFYPTGCLLGCVNVDDCLSQEEYEKRYPDGESDSPYVFICSNPVSLRLRFPIKGQHKIYQLDKTIHQAAMKCIQKTAKIQAEEANAG
ncbi:activating signal cointegrator 1-like [Manduca sexta]|uniref:activating signal cointegrator 1-like n=1 Tax=Manduca sexta TaxID=7130 RepID=UPI00189035B4|nr:activating signal cointegrator 1-like [Manduca sexta]